ncbi:MAG: outer membrane porin GjpA [Mycobacterium sp.]
MHVSHRSYLSAGVAVLGAGAIALSPVQPLDADLTLSPHRANALAVSLAASIDPITPWTNTIEAAVDNITALVGGYAGNPFPIIQQVIENWMTYFGELPDIGKIAGQVFANVGNAVKAPFAVPESCSDPDKAPCETISPATIATGVPLLDTLNQQEVYGLLPLFLGDQYESLKPILEFTTTPVSGVILGLIGPVVGPVISLVNSVEAIFNALKDSDFESAISELINIPANLTNAFLNGGQFLDLAPVLKLVGVTLPDSIQGLGFNMGGLLSAGISPVAPSPTDPVASVMFDGLSFSAAFGEGTIVDPGLSVGPLGSLVGLGNSVAEAIKVTPTAEAPAETAASEAPVSEAAPTIAADPEATDDAAAEEAAAEGAPAQAVAAEDDTVKAAPRTGRAGRGATAGNDSDAGASTPKRAGRSAAARAS